MTVSDGLLMIWDKELGSREDDSDEEGKGTNRVNIELVYGYDRPEEVRVLFEEYTNMLVANDPSFQEYLDLQNYEEETGHLKEKYGMPEGRLYLIYCDGVIAGCIGLRKIDDDSCEMKRLYIRPEFRGRKLSEFLLETLIQDAREIGYKNMLLDTLPFLQSAIHLYQKYGFYEIESYNNSPMDTSIYMKLDL